MLLKFLLGLLSLVPSTLNDGQPQSLSTPTTYTNPAMDLSAIRYLICIKGKDMYSGSAFLIAPHVLATARHVSHGDKCIDVETNTEVKEYKQDDKTDFGLMSAPGIPDNMPVIKYRCDGFKPRQTYLSYGITDFGQARPILRMDILVATKEIVKDDNIVDEFPHSQGMRVLDGRIAAGMSGGPVMDMYGYAVAVNNAGNDHQTLLFGLQNTVLCQ